MSLLKPYRTTLVSKLPSQELTDRLRQQVEPFKLMRTPKLFRTEAYKTFEGQVETYNFDISRIPDGRNSFVPKITGVLSQYQQGTKIDLEMRLKPLIIAVLGISIVFMLIAVTIISITMPNEGLLPVLLLPVPIMALINFFVFRMVFKRECKKAEDILQKLFEAQKKEMR